VFVVEESHHRHHHHLFLTRSSANAEMARVGGHYDIQGHSKLLFLYQSKARMILHISE